VNFSAGKLPSAEDHKVSALSADHSRASIRSKLIFR
jgi:hypothetical protein